MILHAFGPSVYCHIVRMALAECGQTAQINPVDPFAGTGQNPHPFGLVPVLTDGDFEVYETCAILAYLDATYADGRMTPADPKARARMVQVQGIADSQAYVPLVRQVFSHGVFRPAHGLEHDPTVIANGLERSEVVLSALEQISDEGRVLNGNGVTLADCHLAPMIGFFAAVPEGADLLRRFPALAAWWEGVRVRRSYCTSRPPLAAA